MAYLIAANKWSELIDQVVNTVKNSNEEIIQMSMQQETLQLIWCINKVTKMVTVMVITNEKFCATINLYGHKNEIMLILLKRVASLYWYM